MITSDTGVTPSDINACHLIQPSTLATLCRQPQALSPPGQVVTDRHPVTLADSHSRGNWYTYDTPPHLCQGSCLRLAAWEAEGIQGLVLFAGNTGIYNVLFLNLACSRLGYCGAGWVEPSLEPPTLKVSPWLGTVVSQRTDWGWGQGGEAQ